MWSHLSFCLALLTTTMFLLNAGPAAAALITKDLFAPGDGLLTRDPVSGLDWLDLTESTDLSFNEVEADVGGFISQGWRHAFTAEVCDLIGQIGSLGPDPCPGSTAGADVGELAPYVARLGDTGSGGFFGVFNDGSSGLTGRGGGFVDTFGDARLWILRNTTNRDAAWPELGHYLVRPVPEPGTGLLVLVGLAFMARTRQHRFGSR